MLYFQSRLAIEVVETLRELSAGGGLHRPKQLTANFSLEHLQFKKPVEGKLKELLAELKDHAGKAAAIAVLTSLELAFDQWRLTFELPVTDEWWKVHAHRNQPSSGQQPAWEPAQVDPWMHAIAKALTAHPDRPATSREPAQAREASEIQIAAARRMEAVAARIAEELAEVAVKREQALSKRQEELEASISAEREQLSKQRIQFEQEKAERDSREATVVRRQLLDSTLKALDQEKPVLSPETNKKRITITAALLFAMLLGVVLIAVTVYQGALARSEKVEALVLLQSLAASGVVLFGTSLWYFVRWQDRWQQTHATAELHNRKIRRDMLRASWIAELVIETGKEEKIQLSDTLLAEVARGLFVAPEEATVTEHPLEVLFKRARLDRLKIGKTGIELAKNPRSPK